MERCRKLSLSECASFTLNVMNRKDGQNRMIAGTAVVCTNDGGITSTIQFTEPNLLGEHLDDLLLLLNKHFRFRSRGDILRDLVPEHLQQIVEQRERNVDDLESSLRRLEKTTTDLFEEQARRSLKFNEEIAVQAEEQRSKLEEDYQKRREKLDADREAFEVMKRRFDDRDSREVRRELKDQMLEAISEAGDVAVSDSVFNTRKLIHAVSWMAMLIGLVLMALAVARIVMSQSAGVKDQLRWDMVALQLFMPGALLFGTTLVFYLRWSDRWFRDHADIEFQNHRFKHDVLRASWVAEFVVEASKDGREVPEQLLERISRILFEGYAIPGEHHPTDDVAKLLRRVSKLKTGKGVFEVEKPVDPLKSVSK